MGLGSLQLSVHTSLGSPDAPSRVAVEAANLWLTDEYAELGHGDFAYGPRELAATYADTARNRWVMVAAQDRGRCVGIASVQVPEVDNQHLLAVDFRIDPHCAAATVLNSLWSATAELMVAEARSTMVSWVASALPGEPLVPKTGVGAVRRTPLTDWLQAHGFELEQVEVASTLEVAEGLAWAEPLEAEVAQKSDGYDVLSWVGATPAELQDAMAEQRARMSTDVPLGGIALEPEVWDAARVRGEDEVVSRMGRSMLWTVAIERATAAVVAHTLLTCPDEWLPEVAYQEDTLVRAEHRGHRLGLRTKVANLRQLAERRPGVRRIHTWNADENDWMLAINRSLGFRPSSALGCWQLKVAGVTDRDE